MDKKTLILARRRLQSDKQGAMTAAEESDKYSLSLRRDAQLLINMVYDRAISVIDDMLEEALLNEK